MIIVLNVGANIVRISLSNLYELDLWSRRTAAQHSLGKVADFIAMPPEFWPKIYSRLEKSISLSSSPIASLIRKGYWLYMEKMYQLRNLSARIKCFLWRFSRSRISASARIHPSAYISRFRVQIGANCLIGPLAVVYENSILDDHVEIGARCVIGSECLSAVSVRGKIICMIHTGGVHIHRGTRVGSLSCIDKSRDGNYTEIGEGSSIGELVYIPHNVKIGKKCYLAPNSMVSGYVTIGDYVRIGRNASVSDNLIIGNSVTIEPGSVVTKHVLDENIVR